MEIEKTTLLEESSWRQMARVISLKEGATIQKFLTRWLTQRSGSY